MVTQLSEGLEYGMLHRGKGLRKGIILDNGAWRGSIEWRGYGQVEHTPFLLHILPLHLFPLNYFPLYLFPQHLFPLHLFPLHLFPLHLFPLHFFPLSIVKFHVISIRLPARGPTLTGGVTILGSDHICH